MLNFLELIAIYIGIYGILSLSLNLIAGYTGLLSLCHAAFFGIGAYTTAIMMTHGQGFWLSLLLSGLLAGSCGLLIGLPTLRLKGDYLAISTLGFGEIVKNVILNWDRLTRGPMGINGIPYITVPFINYTIQSKMDFLILVWIVTFSTYFLLEQLGRSRYGRAFIAIREDEIAARSLGINPTTYKISAFVIGAFFAGIAGTLWALYNTSVAPQTFDFMLSIMVLSMVVLGGMGNNRAVLLGTAILVITSELPRLLGFSAYIPPQTNQILFGLILVVMMIYRPQGLLPTRRRHILADGEKTDA